MFRGMPALRYATSDYVLGLACNISSCISSVNSRAKLMWQMCKDRYVFSLQCTCQTNFIHESPTSDESQLDLRWQHGALRQGRGSSAGSAGPCPDAAINRCHWAGAAASAHPAPAACFAPLPASSCTGEVPQVHGSHVLHQEDMQHHQHSWTSCPRACWSGFVRLHST